MAEESSRQGLRARARAAGLTKALRAIPRRLGYDLVRRHYYSPIPEVERLPPETWTREDPLAGVRFDSEAGLRFVQEELADYIAEYSPPREPTGNPRTFFLDNTLYEAVDAELLYAMVRRFAPPRIVELGSGMSTLVIADARERGGQTDRAGHVVYDPFIREDLGAALAEVADTRPVSATDVPMDEFRALEAGDMLFVDTTHTVKIGSEVNRIILEVLPSLAPGVIVHVHDIYLPWEYPREFLEERRFFWAEQYLLQAFLAFNPEFEILVGAHALARKFPEQTHELMPSAGTGIAPSAFWMRRVG